MHLEVMLVEHSRRQMKAVRRLVLLLRVSLVSGTAERMTYLNDQALRRLATCGMVDR